MPVNDRFAVCSTSSKEPLYDILVSLAIKQKCSDPEQASSIINWWHCCINFTKHPALTAFLLNVKMSSPDKNNICVRSDWVIFGVLFCAYRRAAKTSVDEVGTLIENEKNDPGRPHKFLFHNNYFSARFSFWIFFFNFLIFLGCLPSGVSTFGKNKAFGLI